MAARVISLLRGERWPELSREGRRLAGEFSWEKSVRRLEDLLREVAAEGKGRR
jgi:glycosyltransferase involved in cell wall biosynthesis